MIHDGGGGAVLSPQLFDLRFSLSICQFLAFVALLPIIFLREGILGILGFAPKFIVRVVDEIQLLTLLYDLLLFTSLS